MKNNERAQFSNIADAIGSKHESQLMSRKEAAAYLGVSEITLAIWKSTGRYGLKTYKIGRLVKYKKCDLDAFIASRAQGG